MFFIFVLALFLSFLYLQKTIWELEDGSRILSRIYARFCAQSLTDEEEALNIIFDEVIENINFPVIVTDENEVPFAWRNIKNIPNIKFDQLNDKEKKYIQRYINRLDRIHIPIDLIYGDKYLGSVHYGETAGIRRLKWAPLIQIVVIFIFILIGIQGFHIIKKGEESFIWTGMAKEIAHQMGTPLSSLLGWISVLRSKTKDEESRQIISSMEKDINRIEEVLGRFSRIGEKPKKEKVELNMLLENVSNYFRRRIPKDGRIKIDYNIEGNTICVIGDRVLLQWAMENLIKNSIDALEGQGYILIRAFEKDNNVIIEVEDNGKGMEKDEVKKIFVPGYSTKRFGWGVGLPLSMRIIEEYHSGHIYVNYTETGKGTIMHIELKGVDCDEKNTMD